MEVFAELVERRGGNRDGRIKSGSTSNTEVSETEKEPMTLGRDIFIAASSFSAFAIIVFFMVFAYWVSVSKHENNINIYHIYS